jgi:uncharacterized protein with von Willebrand factor type A (vWA) domain
MKNLMEQVAAGEPPVQQAVEALRRYHNAQSADALAEEVDRLRREAELLFKAVS